MREVSNKLGAPHPAGALESAISVGARLKRLDERFCDVLPKIMKHLLSDITDVEVPMLLRFAEIFAADPDAFQGRRLREIPIAGTDTKFMERWCQTNANWSQFADR